MPTGPYPNGFYTHDNHRYHHWQQLQETIATTGMTTNDYVLEWKEIDAPV